MRKFKNKDVGGRVIVDSVTITINPIDGWKTLKKVSGVIVERGEHEHYYHNCSGGHTHVSKHVIINDAYNPRAIKLDDGITDIEGNNIIVVREFNLKFIDYLPPKVKVITKAQYDKALKTIEEYEQQTL